METLKERIVKLDFSDVDMGEVSLKAAELHMQDYQDNRTSGSALGYLHVAETNLMEATREGKDTTKQYELLRRLQAERLRD